MLELSQDLLRASENAHIILEAATFILASLQVLFERSFRRALIPQFLVTHHHLLDILILAQLIGVSVLVVPEVRRRKSLTVASMVLFLQDHLVVKYFLGPAGFV